MIIGLIGYIGSGKDTAGEMLYNQGFIRESFAKPLKDAVSAIFGWNRGMLEGDNKVDRAWREQPDEYWSSKFGYDFSPRMALQLMGTEAGRDVFHEGVWLHALNRRLLKTLETRHDANFVITDVRFKNEITKIHEMGGYNIRIQRGPEPAYYEAALAYNASNSILSVIPPELQAIHRSEWDWIGHPLIHTVINNEGTLSDLELKISQFVDEHLPAENLV